MSVTIGVADGGRPHLHPYPHRNKLHRAGSYSATLGLTLFLRDADYSGQKLHAGLLTRPPQPEGGGYDELAAPGYVRQQIEFRWAAPDYDLAAEAVTFGPISPDWAECSHIGVFDDAGMLVAYGMIVPMDRGAAAGAVTFLPGNIRLKRRRRGAAGPG